MKALLLVLFCLSALLVAPAKAAEQKAAAKPTIPAHDPKYGIYPIAYREIIQRWLEKRLLDPGSAQIEYTEPKPIEVPAKGGETFAGYAVEFRVNSRNKFGMYTGFQKHRVLIRNGEILAANRVKN